MMNGSRAKRNTEKSRDMQSMTFHSQVGPDGMLKLEIPVGVANTLMEVTVMMKPLQEVAPDTTGWPAGFFEQTYSILQDEPIERGDQGAYERREELE